MQVAAAMGAGASRGAWAAAAQRARLTSAAGARSASASGEYDLAVLGGGSGGLATARRAAEHGARVVLAEGGRLGGTCVNVGCVPKKVTWEAVNTLEAANHDLGAFGGYSGPDDARSHVEAKIHYPTLKARRDAYVERLNGIYASALKNAGGSGGSIDILREDARLWKDSDGHVAGVEGKETGTVASASSVVIATGSTPLFPASVAGAAELGSDSDAFFTWSKPPASVAVVGGGYIAVELAGMLAALGSETTMLVRGPQVLRHIDPQIADVLHSQLTSAGVDLRLNTIFV